MFFFKEFRILCSFCEDGFDEEKALMDHLMTCGNKTDQCPNCAKYIRRAIFAYHYENNCANIEESPNHDRKHNESQSSSMYITSFLIVNMRLL